VPELVALDLPGGPRFVEALRRLWARGDAAFPVDQRLPAEARKRVIDAMAPAKVVRSDGEEGAWDGQREPTEPGDALVVATSGTTGEPRGVVLTHDALAAHTNAVHARLDLDVATDRWLACLPLSHIGGLGVVCRALIAGVGLDVIRGFDAPAVGRAPRELGTTLVSLVPTALDRLSAAGFRWIVLGGSGDDRDRPTNVLRTYGLTESGGGVYYSVGGLLDGTELRVVDDEIQLRGRTLLRAYRDGTDPRTADGWLPTGDLGSLSSDGRLTVHGRRAELIITGGENVWPAEVEAALARHPQVADVVVAGRPDPEWGQRVVAWVVPTVSADPPTLDALRAHAKEHLPPYACPRELILVDHLAKTALGKLRRSELHDT